MSITAQPHSRTSCAAALAVGVFLLSGVGTAVAQTTSDAIPPPPPIGELPPPPGDSGAPPTPPEPVAPPAGQPGPDAGIPPATNPDPVKSHPPEALIEIVGGRASLRGRRLSLNLRCRDSGTAALRRKGRTVSRASFKCLNSTAELSLKLSVRETKALRRAGGMRFTVRFKIGMESARLPVVAHSLRAGSPRARTAAATTPRWAVSDATCGSKFGASPGLSVDPGYAVSRDGADDFMAYRYRIYTYGDPQREGWKSYGWPPYGWSAWYQAPGFGEIWIGGKDHLGLRSGGGAWVYVAIEKYWHRALPHSKFIYPRVDSDLGGMISGGWCYWAG